VSVMEFVHVGAVFILGSKSGWSSSSGQLEVFKVKCARRGVVDFFVSIL
jgi:hypothetical protein